MMGWYGNGMMNGFGIGMGLVGWLVQLLLFAAVIYLVIILIKKLLNQPQPPATDKSQAILNERLAKGEITEEEYRKLKNLLHE
ncbi:SHOCT domain-containing protein [Sporolactobacillus pectinivorans]|uniref:SHOCT domain-containing protein n=1 Tax=Sporolactobacillus pectinivorans TaxID=1591408 RepID=UPI001EFD3088|nr:SHOCT domain-containing protein [Sporolactobacillus pectinivorans]